MPSPPPPRARNRPWRGFPAAGASWCRPEGPCGRAAGRLAAPARRLRRGDLVPARPLRRRGQETDAERARARRDAPLVDHRRGGGSRVPALVAFRRTDRLPLGLRPAGDRRRRDRRPPAGRLDRRRTPPDARISPAYVPPPGRRPARTRWPTSPVPDGCGSSTARPARSSPGRPPWTASPGWTGPTAAGRSSKPRRKPSGCGRSCRPGTRRGPPRQGPSPAAAAAGDRGRRRPRTLRRPLVAASITHWRKHGTYSEVLVFRPGRQGPQTLLSVPGSLGQVEWSPDGNRLLIAWPGANQWLFLPLGRGKGRAIANISKGISPGGRAHELPPRRRLVLPRARPGPGSSSRSCAAGVKKLR